MFNKGHLCKNFSETKKQAQRLKWPDKWPVLLEVEVVEVKLLEVVLFFRSRKSLSIFLSNFKICIWIFLFYLKNVREEVDFLKTFKVCCFLLGGSMDIIFGLI